MKFILLFSFLAIAGGNNKIIKPPAKDTIDHIKIKCTNLSSLTEASVGCFRFEKAFDPIWEFNFSDKRTIAKLSSLINIATLDTTSVSKNVDTRAKIYIFYKSKDVDSMCLDGIGSIYNKGEIWNLPDNSQLIGYIDSLYYTK